MIDLLRTGATVVASSAAARATMANTTNNFILSFETVGGNDGPSKDELEK